MLKGRKTGIKPNVYDIKNSTFGHTYTSTSMYCYVYREMYVIVCFLYLMVQLEGYDLCLFSVPHGAIRRL